MKPDATLLAQRADRAKRLQQVAREIRYVRAPTRPLEIRELESGLLEFVGYASTFDEPYVLEDWVGEYTEEVVSGAFTKTLAEQADVRFLINHEGLPLARTKSSTLKLSEDEIGLRCEATFDQRDPDVQLIVPKLERRDLAEMSFMFRRIRYEWNEDYDHCKLLELKLYDVSLVTFPANPNTWGGLRGIDLLEAFANTAPDELLAEARSDRGPAVMAAAERARGVLDEVLAGARGLPPEPTDDLPDEPQRDTGLTLEMAQSHLALVKARSH